MTALGSRRQPVAHQALGLSASACIVLTVVTSCDRPETSPQASSSTRAKTSTVPALDSDGRFGPLYDALVGCLPVSPLDSLVRLQCHGQARLLEVQKTCSAEAVSEKCILGAVPRAKISCLDGETVDLVVRMAQVGGPKRTDGLMVRRFNRELIADTVVSVRADCRWRLP